MRYAAIVGYYDKHLARLRGKHPEFKRFLSRFRDTFNQRQRPSVLLLHEDMFDIYRESEAVAAFRDLLAICCVPYARAMVLKVGRSHLHGLKFSNAFAFYPWMIGQDNESLVATTPVLSGFGYTASFTGRTSPEIGYSTIQDLDEPLGGPTLLRYVSTGRAWVLPIEPVSEIENPNPCGCHVRLGLCAGTTRHGDQ